MRRCPGKNRSRAARTLLLVGAALLATDAAAAKVSESALVEAEVPQVETSIGVDFTNQYFYRGIQQEHQGAIAQPWVDFVFPLCTGENTSWSFNAGTWNSLHDGPTGSGGAGSIHYELDAYAGIGVDFAKNWNSSVSYVVLSSPNSAFATVQELDLSISFDDSSRFEGASRGFSGVQPSVTVAWELDGQSDGGMDEGIYLGVSIEPAFDLTGDENHPVSVSFPVVAGFSLSDYFEDGSGSDDFFGFVQGGVSFSTPLNFVPARRGSWTLSAGVSFLFLGDNLETINGGDSSEVIFSLGLGASF